MYDMHTHFIPADVLRWLEENRHTVDAQWEKKDPAKEDFLVVGGKWSFELKTLFTDEKKYLGEQDKAGVHHSLVSPVPQLFLYDFAPEITEDLSEVYNRALAQWVQEHPDTLSALATVPLNAPEKAAGVLRNACHTGLKGAIIGPGHDGNMLTDDVYTPFWEEADRQNAIVFIHPLLCDDPRLKRRMMPRLIGVPWETTVAATDLLLSGIVDQYPNVKILLGHGGGFLPYQIGRQNKGYDMWTPVSKNLQAPPEDYLKRFYYDTVVWNPQALDYLIATVGEDQVVPGSDYPFDLSEWPPSHRGSGAKKLLNLD